MTQPQPTARPADLPMRMAIAGIGAMVVLGAAVAAFVACASWIPGVLVLALIPVHVLLSVTDTNLLEDPNTVPARVAAELRLLAGGGPGPGFSATAPPSTMGPSTMGPATIPPSAPPMGPPMGIAPPSGPPWPGFVTPGDHRPVPPPAAAPHPSTSSSWDQFSAHPGGGEDAATHHGSHPGSGAVGPPPQGPARFDQAPTRPDGPPSAPAWYPPAQPVDPRVALGPTYGYVLPRSGQPSTLYGFGSYGRGDGSADRTGEDPTAPPDDPDVTIARPHREQR